MVTGAPSRPLLGPRASTSERGGLSRIFTCALVLELLDEGHQRALAPLGGDVVDDLALHVLELVAGVGHVLVVELLDLGVARSGYALADFFGDELLGPGLAAGRLGLHQPLQDHALERVVPDSS